jgi:DNA-binding MarR family transcriptional regulator
MHSPHEVFLSQKIALTGRLVGQAFESRLAEHGSSGNAWLILATLMGAAGDSVAMSQRELAQALHVGGPNMTVQLDKLQRQGLVTRRADLADRRVTRVAITPKGRRTFTVLAGVVGGFEAEVQREMSEREASALSRSLDRIHSALGGATD